VRDPRCWAVLVYIRGIYTGWYERPTWSDAATEAKRREVLFGVLGCRYVVKPVYRLQYRRS